MGDGGAVKYLSVCSGIEARQMTKVCCKCGIEKVLDEFHRQPTGPAGRHSWCKPCANVAQKASRAKHGRPKTKRQWLLKSRYRLTPDDVDAFLIAQGSACGICAKTFNGRYHIDHDHVTQRVRGLLCHRCNVVIGGLDDPSFRAKAVAWLERGR
jgi:hypothetical protein